MLTRRTAHGKRVKSLRADWYHPTEIWFGAGRAAELPAACGRLGVTRPLLVTGPKLARRPFSRRLVDANQRDGIQTAVFSRISGEPDSHSIAAGAEMFLTGGFDGIIALGGGGSIDTAKAIALAAAVGPERIWEFVFRPGVPHPTIQGDPIPPVIAVPTTAGTGSEVNGAAVITDAAHRVKRSLFYPDLLPRIVIADPTATRGLSPLLTAASGMDALAHNLEALCAPAFNPMLDAVALQGIRYIHDWLPTAFGERRNIHARAYTMAASIMGAVAFEKGLGAMHAMGHAVGALFKTPHGIAIGAVMPYVLRFNHRRIKEKMAAVAHRLELRRHDTQGVVTWLRTFRLGLNLPCTLGELGVSPAHIPELVDRTLADANAPTNPVPLDARGVARLFKWAIQGKF